MQWENLHGHALDWTRIEAALPFVAEMRACIQDSTHHAEGDVWTHIKMVVEALLSDAEFHRLAENRKAGVFLAALLHDIAKNATRAEEFDAKLGRIKVTHRYHSIKGARMAWKFLWSEATPRDVRQQVFALIAWHQKVFFVFAAKDPRREIISFSTLGRWRELLILGRADIQGRISDERTKTVETLELTAMLAEEHNCLDLEWPFESKEGRTRFMRNVGFSPFFNPQPAAGSRVIVMHGLPGSGKDTYIARNLKDDYVEISLDKERAKLGIKPGEKDGLAIQAAYEAARSCLRARTAFVWNATNLTRLSRDKIIDLCLAYDAHVEIHALDPPVKTVREQNRDREQSVSDAVIDNMTRNWEPPGPYEAHGLLWRPLS